MYLSRSCKKECTNAWYNARNATVCIVYVWMGGHQLLPGKQSLQSPCPGMYINFWPWDTLKLQLILMQSIMAVVSSALNPVGSSHWTRASSAPLTRHQCGSGSEQYWKNNLQEPGAPRSHLSTVTTELLSWDTLENRHFISTFSGSSLLSKYSNNICHTI